MTTEPLSCLLDRLADGELDEPEYRDLLARLDAEPDGWRACALVLLEAQALRRELRSLVDDETHHRSRGANPVAILPGTSAAYRGVPHAARTARQGRPPSGRAIVGLAAGILCAFLAGGAWQQWRSGDAQQATVTPRGTIAQRDAVAQRDAAERVAKRQVVSPPARETSSTTEPAEPISHVRLVMRGMQGSPQQVEVPVYPWQDAARLPANETAVVPPEIIAAVEQLGGYVEREHYLAPLPLDDGRQAIVPIEQVRIVPVAASRRAY